MAVALLSCACGGGARGGGSTLEFWALGREGEVVRDLVPGFERENPGIRVRIQQIPVNAAHEKLLTAFVGRATPDAAHLGNTWVPEFAAINALERLDGRVAGSSVVGAERDFPGVWDTNVVAGGVYGIPWYVDTRLIFYRRDLLSGVGVTRPPRTWAAWLDAMTRLKARASPGQYAILLPTDEWQQPVTLALQKGSDLLRDGGRYGDFRGARFREAAAFYVDLFRRGLAPAVSNSQLSNAYQQFARGDFAMWITGPWNVGEFRRRLPREQQDLWGTAALPAPEGEAAAPGVGLAGGASLVIFRASPRKEEAWRWIEYLSRPESQLAFYRLSGDLPARRAAWKDPALISDDKEAAFQEQLGHVKATPKVPEWEQIAQKIAEELEPAVRGRRSLDAALASLDAEVDRILEKRRWMLSRRASR